MKEVVPRVPPSWESVRLDRLFVQRGESARSDDEAVSAFIDGKVTLRSNRPDHIIKNSGQEIGYKHVEPGDLVISGMNAHLGGLGISDSAGKCTPVYTVLRAIAPVDNDFISYVLWNAAQTGYIKSLVNAVRYNSSDFTPETVKRIFVSLPPLAEQRRIADFLDDQVTRIDQAIHLRKRQSDLVRTRYLSLVDRLVGQPDFPKVKLRRVLGAPPKYGANEAADNDRLDWPRYIRTTDVDGDGNLRPETFRSISPAIASEYPLLDGDLLVTRSGATVGKSFVYREQWGHAAFAGYLIRLRVDRERVLPEWLQTFFQSDAYWSQIGAGASQATIQNVGAQKYADLLIPLPALFVQESTAADLLERRSVMQESVLRLGRSVDLLEERKRSLITAAVTGEFDVSSASSRAAGVASSGV